MGTDYWIVASVLYNNYHDLSIYQVYIYIKCVLYDTMTTVTVSIFLMHDDCTVTKFVLHDAKYCD